MIKIVFTGEDAAELKLKIQEYSLIHLGLNLKAIAQELKPHVQKEDNVKPGQSSTVQLSDGTVRTHNPNYPARQLAHLGNEESKPPETFPAPALFGPLPPVIPTAEEVERKRRGRPTGYRKYPIGTPTKAQVISIIRALDKKMGVDAVVEAFHKVGYANLTTLPPDRYAKFIFICHKIAGEELVPVVPEPKKPETPETPQPEGATSEPIPEGPEVPTEEHANIEPE
jgi:hypothetical protein